jgi:hypothetical protein
MADQTERLLLQVDAATELLRRSLVEGEQPLNRFEQRAAKMAENVEGSIGSMGKRFGAFADLAESAAARTQKSFEASFSQVQRVAATAIKGPTISGGINLGAEDIRAGAAAAQDQARAFALIAEAAERTASAERDTSEATRLFIQATNASRIEAEQKATALLAEAGALERVEIELRQSAEATELFVTKHQRIAEAAAEQQRLSVATAESAREQKALGASAEALRASIDPMFAAQQRFDAELARAETLLSAGAISTREYDAAVRLASESLQAHAAQVSGAVEKERQLAASTQEAARGQRALAAAADILRAELDPMFLAQKRFDDELNRADALYKAGIIAVREYEQAQQQARNTLQGHAEAVAGASASGRQLVEVQQRGTVSAGQQKAAMQQLSYQLNDVATQFGSGTPLLQIFAQQSGQVFQALGMMSFGAGGAAKAIENTADSAGDAGTDVAGLGDQVKGVAEKAEGMTGKFGAAAAFLSGPWGAAVIAAVTILVPFVVKLLEANDAVADAVDKLTKDAEQTEVTRQAKEKFAQSAAGVAAAIRDGTAATKASIDGLRTSAEATNIAAKQNLEHEISIRRVTLAQIAQAKVLAENAKGSSLAANGPGSGQSVVANQYAVRVDELTKQLSDQQKLIDEAQARVSATRVDLATEAAARAVDPMARIKKLYDDQANAARAKAREEKSVTSELTKQLAAIERNRKAAIKAEQDRTSASTRKPNNNQIGRDVNVAEATSIIAGIGGRVTSGLRSTERQAQLYADKLAGRHAGPVAKPGTSDHERGQAIDVAYGPGISVSSIRQAFAKEGVAIRQLIDERDQKVFHVAFGKKGTSQQTVDDRAERARQKVLSDDISYGQEEQAARQRLTAATRKSAQTQEQRDAELVASINADADSRKQKIDLQQEKGLSKARADNLRSLSEQTRVQYLQNAAADRAMRVIEQRYDVDRQSLESRVALLRISEDMAPTERERARIAEQILEAEQTLRRQALERVRDTSKDPDAVMSAQRSLGALPALEGAERGQLAQQTASPLEAYRERLKSTTSDTNAAIQGIAVNALGSLESSVSSSIGKVLELEGAFGEMASSVIADLARIAIQKAIVGTLGGKFLGFADGGSLDGIPGRADGGSLGGLISGPGHGRSDSILALLKGPGGGAVRLSNREFIMNEAAVNHYGPGAMAAINARRLPRFANGGSLGGSPSLPSLRAPRLPAAAFGGGANRRMQLDANVTVNAGPEFEAKMERVSLRTVGATAEPIMAGASARTMRQLNRGQLPGAFD